MIGHNPWALVVADEIQLMADLNEGNRLAVFKHRREKERAADAPVQRENSGVGLPRLPLAAPSPSRLTTFRPEVEAARVASKRLASDLRLVGYVLVCAAGTAYLLTRLIGLFGGKG